MTDAWRPKMLPPMWVAVGLAAMYALHRRFPVHQLLDGWWRLAGFGPLAVGIALAVWAERQFAKAGTGLVPGREITTFVRTGPFRFTRNPMYVGMSFALAGAALLFGSLSPMLVALLFPLIIHWRFVRHEESMLIARFGEEAWRTYSSHVRRWL